MNTIELKNTLKNIASNQTKYDAATTDSIINVSINYYNITDTTYDYDDAIKTFTGFINKGDLIFSKEA